MKDFSLRINDDLLKKLHYVAKYEDRSANKEILWLIRRHIAAFEAANGEIPLPDDGGDASQ